LAPECPHPLAATATPVEIGGQSSSCFDEHENAIAAIAPNALRGTICHAAAAAIRTASPSGVVSITHPGEVLVTAITN